LTGEIQLIEGLDGLWTFLLMALYIFPGLLSDAIAFFFLMPPVKKWLLEVFVEFCERRRSVAANRWTMCCEKNIKNQPHL
jgi:UPF0716 family protein affecting phage T7 exclusion